MVSPVAAPANVDGVGGSGNAVCDHLVERTGVRDHHLRAEPVGDEVGTTVRELDRLSPPRCCRRTVSATSTVSARSTETTSTSVAVKSLITNVVDPAECAQFDALDVVEVHGDVRDVAREQRASAVGGNVEALADIRAVEEHRVGSVLAFDHVAAIARIPLEHVIARAEQRGVVALLAVDEVVAVAAEQEVRAIAAADGVVARAAVHGDGDQRREIARGVRRNRHHRSCSPRCFQWCRCRWRKGRDSRGRSALACRWR